MGCRQGHASEPYPEHGDDYLEIRSRAAFPDLAAVGVWGGRAGPDSDRDLWRNLLLSGTTYPGDRLTRCPGCAAGEHLALDPRPRPAPGFAGCSGGAPGGVRGYAVDRRRTIRRQARRSCDADRHSAAHVSGRVVGLLYTRTAGDTPGPRHRAKAGVILERNKTAISN